MPGPDFQNPETRRAAAMIEARGTTGAPYRAAVWPAKGDQPLRTGDRPAPAPVRHPLAEALRPAGN